MKKTKILIIIIIILIAVALIYRIFFGKGKTAYTLATVSWGQVSQEVSETATVKMGDEVELSFRTSGKLEDIYVKVGDVVKKGDSLAKLETSQLSFQIKQSQAALDVAQTKLKQLLIGASAEDIKLAETAVANAQTNLENKKQALNDVQSLAGQNLTDAYQNSLVVLNDADLKAFNAFQTAQTIQTTYFSNAGDQQGLKVRDNKNKIKDSLDKIEYYLGVVKADPKNENIDLALSETKKALDSIFTSLSAIRQSCEESSYASLVSSTDKTSLDTQKLNINTALTSVVGSQQTNSLTKINNTTNINAAQAAVSTAQGALEQVQDQLAKIKAPPRREDVDLYQAQVRQAEAGLSLLRDQSENSIIISPAAGQITGVEKRIGETVQLSEPVFSFLSANPFQLETDIYEEDVVKVQTGDPVEIKLTAFPGETFRGKVIAIDPAEKLISGVVYYRVIIDFDQPPPETKPGMTSDILIETAKKENVLTVPDSSVTEKDGKNIVEVLKDEKIEEREVVLGLKGSNDFDEVISGLSEGEQVIIK